MKEEIAYPPRRIKPLGVSDHETYRVIVAGGRDLKVTKRAVEEVANLLRLAHARVVLSGRCTGGDKIGELAAAKLGIPVDPYPAEWEKYGDRAGPIRNREMAKNADACILLIGGKGTKNMRHHARLRGLWIIEASSIDQSRRGANVNRVGAQAEPEAGEERADGQRGGREAEAAR